MIRKIAFILLSFISSVAYSQKSTVLYSDNFENKSDQWRVEFEQPNTSTINWKDGILDLISSRGATVWLDLKLSGNIEITYDETLIEAGGAFDRVSDMNAFWMATDPKNSKGIFRDGKFSSYDDLDLYYAGVGGHDNKFTRFRKYHSNGEKPVLKEYTDAPHLLVGNKIYKVRIVVNNGVIQYYRDGELFWELKDETPYREGYFGFRTTISHQQFDNFKVVQLK